jgi:hypothetical protein
MTDPAPRHRTVARRRALVLLAVAAVLLAGCDLATGTVRTATELQKAGIDNPNLDYDGGTATLDYDADPNPLEARTEQDRAAAIIWDNLPFRIDRITIDAKGGVFAGRREYPRALLEQELGPRPANLDRSVSDIARRASLIAVVVALVVLVLIIVVVVLVVRAVRRHPAPQPAGGWPQGPGGGPQPWGQPGWGQPAPPGQQPWGPPGQQPWGPPGQQRWGQPPPPAQQPWGGQPPAPDWPAGAPRPDGEPAPPPQWTPPASPPPSPPAAQPPARGPGDTQRLEPGPPPGEEPGPVPPP